MQWGIKEFWKINKCKTIHDCVQGMLGKLSVYLKIKFLCITKKNIFDRVHYKQNETGVMLCIANIKDDRL